MRGEVTERAALAAKRLRKRIEQRQLTWNDVVLAAYLGHRGALAACYGKRPIPAAGRVWSGSQQLCKGLFSARRRTSPRFAEDHWWDEKDLSRIGDWAYGLAPWGKLVLLQAALAAAKQVLPKFEGKFPQDHAPRQAIEAAASVLEQRCRVKSRPVLAACRAALTSARRAARANGFDHDIMPGRCAAYDAACAANQAAKLAHLILTSKDPSDVLSTRLMTVSYAFVTSRAVRYAAGAASPPRVAAAVRRALLKDALKPEAKLPRLS